MADTVKISGLPVPRPEGRPGKFREGRKTKTFSGLQRSPAATVFWSALERLERILASGQALRHDVPRGYYLNILV